MKTTIWGNILPAVTIDLEQGESIYTESGGMTWMSDKVKMDTNMKGGFMKGLGRMFSGESLFMATYTAEAPNQSITIASSFPGEIKELHISSDKEFICQKSAFLCAEQSVELSTYITSGIKKGLFGGEGFPETVLLSLSLTVQLKKSTLLQAKNLKSIQAVLRFLNQPSNMTLKQ